jgi:putative ABC transport system permease protein
MFPATRSAYHAVLSAMPGRETAVRATVPAPDLAYADVVIAGNQHFDHLDEYTWAFASERVRIDADLVDTVATVPGVAEIEAHLFDHPAPAGTIDAIGVVAEAGTDLEQLRERIDAALTDGVVTLVGDQRGFAERPEAMLSAEGLTIMAAVIASWSILIAVFGVSSMLALSIQQRHRELALLRAVGTTPGQLRKLVLGETVMVAAVATALAILPGRWLSARLFDRLVDTGVVLGGLEFRMGWVPTVAAFVLAVLAAAGGAVVAGGRAARTRPTEALAAAGLPERRPLARWRLLLGLVLLAGAIGLLVVTMTINSGPLASATGSPAVLFLAQGVAVGTLRLCPLRVALTGLQARGGQELADTYLCVGLERLGLLEPPDHRAHHGRGVPRTLYPTGCDRLPGERDSSTTCGGGTRRTSISSHAPAGVPRGDTSGDPCADG